MADITEITDLLAPELDIYARVNEIQLKCRADLSKGMFIAETPVVLDRALEGGMEPVSLLMEDRVAFSPVGRDLISRCGDVPVYVAKIDVLKELTGYNLTRGVLCAMKRPPLRKASEIIKAAKRIAVLEDVMNPTNLGAIFRSAAALGADGILITSNSTDPLYRRALRVAVGTVFQVPWTVLSPEESESAAVLSLLKEAGFTTAAMALTDKSLSVSAPEPLSSPRLALFFGTEAYGLRPETVAGCDYTLKIPMYGGVDSLNVAAASAVAFWQLFASQKEKEQLK